MKNGMEVIERYGVLPVINVTEIGMAKPLAEALCRGGLPLIEVTLRSDCSLEVIRTIKKAYPDMTVGAGTVLSEQDAEAAISAGADYVVSPGYDAAFVRYCCERQISVVPGCTTPSEIQDAVKQGLRVLKFFPSELNGGLAAIKLLSGPFPEVRFLPTGGIGFGNLESYLSCERVLACGGSFMATSAQLKSGDYDGIEAACRQAVSLSLGFRLAHIGINHENREAATETAHRISEVFGFTERACSTSSFAGNVAECMDHSRYGKNGHIGISTHSMTRAMAFLSDRGIEFDPISAKYDSKGNLTCIYFRQDMGGFAWHIVKEG